VLPAAIRGDASGGISATDWDSTKEAYAGRGDRDHRALCAKPAVEDLKACGHLDLERENPNLIGGDSLSGSVAGYSHYRTPVKGLYLCDARRGRVRAPASSSPARWPGDGAGLLFQGSSNSP
jgi:hypothetical protein